MDGTLRDDISIDIDVRLDDSYVTFDGKTVNKNSESVDVSITADNLGIKIFGESKVRAGNHFTDAFDRAKRQFVKHIDIEVLPLFDAGESLDDVKLIYHFQGSAFSDYTAFSAMEIAEEMMEFYRKERPNLFGGIVDSGFVFDANNVNIVNDHLYPFVN